MDASGRTLFCFKTPDNIESPTLHVKPGDTLNITLTNRVPPARGNPQPQTVSFASNAWCGSPTMTDSSVNMHFHGTNVSPTCHSDEVIHTMLNSGQRFQYSIHFPTDEPPGLYWYHPHVHGISEAALLGGATGVIVVDGIEALQHDVAGLPTRLLVLRDQTVAGNPDPGGAVPAWDISLNYVPISYPDETPAVMDVPAGRREFWRVANTSSDTIDDVQLNYDGVAQDLEVVALDGVPTGSQDGTRKGRGFTRKHVLLPPGGRAEFIITTPTSSVHKATFDTLAVDTGPYGDNDTRRTLAVLHAGAASPQPMAMATDAMPQATAAPTPQRFEGLSQAAVATKRKLYFSEVLSDPSDPASPTNFFITVDGATPTLFNPKNPPAITTTQGSVEEWTIENRAQESHEFHMHQIHFLLVARNRIRVGPDDQQFLDTVQVPYWSGVGPYPSVTVMMDFRGAVVGDFVYHCHILGHEDNGMMAIIRVLPRHS